MFRYLCTNLPFEMSVLIEICWLKRTLQSAIVSIIFWSNRSSFHVRRLFIESAVRCTRLCRFFFYFSISSCVVVSKSWFVSKFFSSLLFSSSCNAVESSLRQIRCDKYVHRFNRNQIPRECVFALTHLFPSRLAKSFKKITVDFLHTHTHRKCAAAQNTWNTRTKKNNNEQNSNKQKQN